MSRLEWSWLGRMTYQDALIQQRQRRQKVIDGTNKEIVFMLEHEPVITTGRRPVEGLPSKVELREKGIDLAHTERGGLATFHGPGQLIAYPIIDAWQRGLGAKGTVHALESAVIAWLANLDICASRRTGFPGVWVENEKICAIGMHFKKGVSIHGLALNLHPDLSGFAAITPCGITDGGVTSVAKILADSPTPKEATETIAPLIIENLNQPCGLRSRTC